MNQSTNQSPHDEKRRVEKEVEMIRKVNGEEKEKKTEEVKMLRGQDVKRSRCMEVTG